MGDQGRVRTPWARLDVRRLATPPVLLVRLPARIAQRAVRILLDRLTTRTKQRCRRCVVAFRFLKAAQKQNFVELLQERVGFGIPNTPQRVRCRFHRTGRLGRHALAGRDGARPRLSRRRLATDRLGLRRTSLLGRCLLLRRSLGSRLASGLLFGGLLFCPRCHGLPPFCVFSSSRDRLEEPSTQEGHSLLQSASPFAHCRFWWPQSIRQKPRVLGMLSKVWLHRKKRRKTCSISIVNTGFRRQDGFQPDRKLAYD